MQSNALTSFVLLMNLMLVQLQAQSQPSEPRMTRTDYIEKYREQAIREMHSSGVPASITLAQGMLESDYGNSPLAKYANNHFGIKCHKGWEGPSFIQDDDEKNECFRKYYDAYDSYRDHSEFLRTRERYATLFELKTTDYKGWAHGLKAAGYATNPKYADLLIKIIEENSLSAYDEIIKAPAMTEVAEIRPTHKNTTPKVLAVQQIQVSENHIKYVSAIKGDTPESIASRYNLGAWQILKYNDLKKNQSLVEGDVIYLQPKRNYAHATSHQVREGESLHDISQHYGVKMKQILKLNQKDATYVPSPGDELKLRKGGR